MSSFQNLSFMIIAIPLNVQARKCLYIVTYCDNYALIDFSLALSLSKRKKTVLKINLKSDFSIVCIPVPKSNSKLESVFQILIKFKEIKGFCANSSFFDFLLLKVHS